MKFQDFESLAILKSEMEDVRKKTEKAAVRKNGVSQRKPLNNDYISEVEFKKRKDDIYKSIKVAHERSSTIPEYKKRIKKLRRKITNKSLLAYFDKIYVRFMEYKKKNILERQRRPIFYENIHDEISDIFKEAGGLSKRGTAYEQGAYKYSSKLIYIAQK